MNQELLAYVQSQLGAGVSKEDIREILMSQGGWDADEVEQAFVQAQSASISFHTTSAAPFSADTSKVKYDSDLNFSEKPKRKLLKPLFIGLGLIAVVGTIYFVGTYFFKGGFSKPGTAEGFLVAFVSGVQKLERFGYEIEGSLKLEPRDGNIEPIDLSEPAYSPGTIEGVKEDIKRIEDAAVINSAITDYIWDKEWGSDILYPLSLTELNIKDLHDERGINSSNYSYVVHKDRKNAELTIVFETQETLNHFRRLQDRYDYSEEKIKINIADRSITFPLKNDMFLDEFGLTYMHNMDSILPKNPVIQAFESFGMLMQFLPDRFSSEFTFSGTVDTKNEIPDSKLASTAYVDWGDMIFRVGFEAITKDGDFYGRINNFPTLPIPTLNVDPILGKWIKVSNEEMTDWSLAESLLDSWQDIAEEYDKNAEDLDEFLEIISTAFSKHNPLMLKTTPKNETLDSGRSAIKYDLGINGEKISDFAEYVFERSVGLFYEEDEEIEKSRASFEESLRYMKSSEFLQLIDYLNKNGELSIWLDSKEGYPVQLWQKLTYVADPSEEGGATGLLSMIMGGGNRGSLENQLVSTTKIKLTDINKPIRIEAPAEYIPAEDLEEVMYGSEYANSLKAAREQAADASIQSYLNNIRVQAEMYYDSNGFSYTGACTEDFAILNSIEWAKESQGTPSVSCFDSQEEWAAEARLKDGSYYCVDSTGASGEYDTSTISASDMVCG